jgi:hypothetical protein
MSDDPVHGSEAERFGGWDWRDPRRGESHRTCSYCGSCHPEDVVAAVKRAWELRSLQSIIDQPAIPIDWADRKYGWPHKFYLDIPNENPKEMFVVGSASGGKWDTGEESPGEAYVAWDKMSRQQKKVVKRDRAYWLELDGTMKRPAFVMFGTREVFHAKFYTTHLGDPAISDEVKEAVYAAGARRYTFDGGVVRWEPA